MCKSTRQFVAYFWFVGWDCISLGLHVCLTAPNVEIHLPFGFIRIGWVRHATWYSRDYTDPSWRGLGLKER